MENVLRVTSNLEVSGFELEAGPKFRDGLKELLGEKCKGLETVHPLGLYSELGCKKDCRRAEKGSCVMMVVCDDSAIIPGRKINFLGTWLYETSETPSRIYGDILFVGEDEEGGYCPINDKTAVHLKEQLIELSNVIRRETMLRFDDVVSENGVGYDA